MRSVNVELIGGEPTMSKMTPQSRLGLDSQSRKLVGDPGKSWGCVASRSQGEDEAAQGGVLGAEDRS